MRKVMIMDIANDPMDARDYVVRYSICPDHLNDNNCKRRQFEPRGIPKTKRSFHRSLKIQQSSRAQKLVADRWGPIGSPLQTQ